MKDSTSTKLSFRCTTEKTRKNNLEKAMIEVLNYQL